MKYSVDKIWLLLLIAFFACFNLVGFAQEGTAEDDGLVHVPAYVLPESVFLSDETRAALKRQREAEKIESARWSECSLPENPTKEQIDAARQCSRLLFYQTRKYIDMQERYDVSMEVEMIDGVYTEVFVPADGIREENRDRVLINLHSGAFFYGSRTASHLESIPIASLGGIKVVSVDYRQGPDHQFPAASEDVAIVYRALLKTHKPENIGIYGVAGGGALTAQSVAWLLNEGLPLPGAVGMICMAAAEPRPKSDSMYMVSAILGYEGIAPFDVFEPYYTSSPDFEDPLLVPQNSESILSRFPPSLLVGSTRDFHLSSIVHMHAELVKLGVETDLHVWEGMGHVFLNNAEIPESRDAYDVIVKFFSKHLGG
ncbi:alpha/beta hydrolase [Puniceicoccaceae bacterium K14]|nr:alpha/beta hydrolase [Puniceicoccaceae bacterium K14]